MAGRNHKGANQRLRGRFPSPSVRRRAVPAGRSNRGMDHSVIPRTGSGGTRNGSAGREGGLASAEALTQRRRNERKGAQAVRGRGLGGSSRRVDDVGWDTGNGSHAQARSNVTGSQARPESSSRPGFSWDFGFCCCWSRACSTALHIGHGCRPSKVRATAVASGAVRALAMIMPVQAIVWNAPHCRPRARASTRAVAYRNVDRTGGMLSGQLASSMRAGPAGQRLTAIAGRAPCTSSPDCSST